MSIILLDTNIKPKIYYVTGVPSYTNLGVGKKLPALLAAAMGLREAVRNNCEEICVEVQGRLPRRYKTSDVLQKCRDNVSLHKYLPIIPQKAQIVTKHLTSHFFK